MSQDLGPPAMFQAAEKVLSEALQRANQEHPEDACKGMQLVLSEAGENSMLAGAIIFLHLGYTLEALNRRAAPIN